MATLQPVRGTHDLLPEDERRHRAVSDCARKHAALYGFEAIATPIIEFKDVFVRSVGETSDIVSKEMFQVASPNAESDDAAMVLRPENTASVVRALIGGNRLQTLPQRVFYSGPMFRYERPQKGRLRQFHQIGVELIGAASPLADVEAILLAGDILNELLPNARLRLELNTLGDKASRTAYRAALVEYFSDRRADLSEISRDRLERNPLRILNSKDPGDRPVITSAPTLYSYLTPEAIEFFDTIKAVLKSYEFGFVSGFEVTPRLVRGLDYYTHTVFEFTTDQLGAQGTILAGGRYDGLVEQMGGPSTPGVGWAAGIERIAALMADPPVPAAPVIIIAAGGTGCEHQGLWQAHLLRAQGIAVELIYSGGIKKGLQRANRLGARYAVIIGETELAAGNVVLKDLDAQQQSEIAKDDLVRELKQRLTEGNTAS